MAMLNLALRPMSAFLLYRVVQDRATDHGGSSTLPSSLQGIFNDVIGMNNFIIIRVMLCLFYLSN
ncbi:hypothetical protein E2C01_095651 [Portunus trituberculatus]|uniref:Uncharacterized protein n=1 Tax=Portunus trituberculatus TaxID=210409 RepID=A0A5B7JVT9_PORTR|nr:hypothetical protein [Portunus trituberculatus]